MGKKDILNFWDSLDISTGEEGDLYLSEIIEDESATHAARGKNR